MPRGHPDYNEYNYTNAFSKDLQDEAFVARHGIAPLTNPGRVYMADFFENGISGWEAAASGGGTTPAYKYDAQFSLLRGLVVELAPAVLNGISQINRDVFTNVQGKQGFEFLLVPKQSHGSIDLNFIYTYATNDRETYYFGYDVIAGKWYAGDAINAGYFKTEPISDIFQKRLLRVKFIINVANRTFDKFFLGDLAMDLSSHTPLHVATGDAGQAKTVIAVKGRAGVYIQPVNVCGFIWTVDEP